MTAAPHPARLMGTVARATMNCFAEDVLPALHDIDTGCHAGRLLSAAAP